MEFLGKITHHYIFLLISQQQPWSRTLLKQLRLHPGCLFPIFLLPGGAQQSGEQLTYWARLRVEVSQQPHPGPSPGQLGPVGVYCACVGLGWRVDGSLAVLEAWCSHTGFCQSAGKLWADLVPSPHPGISAAHWPPSVLQPSLWVLCDFKNILATGWVGK